MEPLFSRESSSHDSDSFHRFEVPATFRPPIVISATHWRNGDGTRNEECHGCRPERAYTWLPGGDGASGPDMRKRTRAKSKDGESGTNAQSLASPRCLSTLRRFLEYGDCAMSPYEHMRQQYVRRFLQNDSHTGSRTVGGFVAGPSPFARATTPLSHSKLEDVHEVRVARIGLRRALSLIAQVVAQDVEGHVLTRSLQTNVSHAHAPSSLSGDSMHDGTAVAAAAVTSTRAEELSSDSLHTTHASFAQENQTMLMLYCCVQALELELDDCYQASSKLAPQQQHSGDSTGNVLCARGRIALNNNSDKNHNCMNESDSTALADVLYRVRSCIDALEQTIVDIILYVPMETTAAATAPSSPPLLYVSNLLAKLPSIFQAESWPAQLLSSRYQTSDEKATVVLAERTPTMRAPTAIQPSVMSMNDTAEGRQPRSSDVCRSSDLNPSSDDAPSRSGCRTEVCPDATNESPIAARSVLSRLLDRDGAQLRLRVGQSITSIVLQTMLDIQAMDCLDLLQCHREPSLTQLAAEQVRLFAAKARSDSRDFFAPIVHHPRDSIVLTSLSFMSLMANAWLGVYTLHGLRRADVQMTALFYRLQRELEGPPGESRTLTNGSASSGKVSSAKTRGKSSDAAAKRHNSIRAQEAMLRTMAPAERQERGCRLRQLYGAWKTILRTHYAAFLSRVTDATYVTSQRRHTAGHTDGNAEQGDVVSTSDCGVTNVVDRKGGTHLDHGEAECMLLARHSIFDVLRCSTVPDKSLSRAQRCALRVMERLRALDSHGWFAIPAFDLVNIDFLSLTLWVRSGTFAEKGNRAIFEALRSALERMVDSCVVRYGPTHEFSVTITSIRQELVNASRKEGLLM